MYTAYTANIGYYVIFVEHTCTNPQAPNNGEISCVKFNDSTECKLTCNRGYGFALTPASM